MKEYKNPFTIRKDHLTCPLPLTLESYWACEADCLHCVARKLNRTWGHEQRATDPDVVEKRLSSALRNKNPRSPLSTALHNRKVIWIGRKTDPYQPVENELEVTRRLIKILTFLEYPFLICSRYPTNACRDVDLFLKAGKSFTFLVEITPGGESDREIFERKRTTPVEHRLRLVRKWQRKGIHIGVRGEPFIPGYHTADQFRDTLRMLRSHDLTSYNTYNLHMNEYTLLRLHEAGLDIERIWSHNQDRLWKPLQRQLCQIAEEEGIKLGCPDFVNVPPDWRSPTTTCCGVDISECFLFNTHHWRRMLQQGYSPEDILKDSWEGIGKEEDIDQAEKILTKRSNKFYTMKDAGL